MGMYTNYEYQYITLAYSGEVFIFPYPKCKQCTRPRDLCWKMFDFVMYLLAQNHNERVDIYVLHLCVSKWLNEKQQNANKCYFEVVQMIWKDVSEKFSR